jgi:hypothetical protein
VPAPPLAELTDTATDLLRRLTGKDDATFRDGQLEAITALVAERKRVLVVQRTGWGKSAVYFVATRLLRDAGAGPTVLISPLLALMRNQIGAAERAGVMAATINSDNRDDWTSIEEDGGADERADAEHAAGAARRPYDADAAGHTVGSADADAGLSRRRTFSLPRCVLQPDRTSLRCGGQQ